MRFKNIVLLSTVFMCFFNSNGLGVPHKKINKILILGNSIVAHDPKPDIGWTGNWGMAASCRDSDFVHVLIRMIQEKNDNVLVKSKNIAVFENYYTTYRLEQLRSFKEFKPDMIIIKLSENINDSTAMANDFLNYYKELIKYLDPKERAVKIIVDGFWPRPIVNKIVKQVAIDGGYDFVSITSLFDDRSNSAKGLFEHEGVANHPSDKGMRNIALSIWNCISKYFPKN